MCCCRGVPRQRRPVRKRRRRRTAVEFIALRHEWVRSVFGIDPNRLLLETAVGESMVPGIQDGDLLLIDATENRFRSFGVYVLEIAGERLVKRVQPKLDGSPGPDQRQRRLRDGAHSAGTGLRHPCRRPGDVDLRAAARIAMIRAAARYALVNARSGGRD